MPQMSFKEAPQANKEADEALRISRRTIESPREPGTLVDLLDSIDEFVEYPSKPEIALQVLNQVNSRFRDWFGAVMEEDREKLGEKWGKAEQAVIGERGALGFYEYTTWRFSWDEISASHQASISKYSDKHRGESIVDNENWGAVVSNFPDWSRGRIKSFEYNSTRQMNFRDIQEKRRAPVATLRNRSLKLGFDDKGELTKLSYTRNLALPNEIRGEGSEILKTWEIDRNPPNLR